MACVYHPGALLGPVLRPRPALQKVCRLVAEINALFILWEPKIMTPREPGKGI
jgi:hypothetical protein